MRLQVRLFACACLTSVAASGCSGVIRSTDTPDADVTSDRPFQDDGARPDGAVPPDGQTDPDAVLPDGAPTDGPSQSDGTAQQDGTVQPDGGPPPSYIGTQGMLFERGGQTFRYVGANIRGITHYGHGDALPFSQQSEVALNFQELSNMGGKVYRAFVAYNGITPQQAGDRMEYVLDLALQYDLYMIAALTDFYAATPFHPQGDDGYYQVDLNGFNVLNHDWFASGYQNNYRPFVQYLVNRFAGHEGLFAWELGNEIKDATFANSDPNTFITFCHTMADFIRNLDPNHLITVGLISVPNAGLSFTQGQTLFGHPHLAFLTVRSYHGSGDDDTPLAQNLNKPIIVEEAGFSTSDGDRPTLTQTDLNLWFGRGVAGYLQWGFMASNNDNGDGDTVFGMDRVFHSDWNGLFTTYQNFAASL